VPAAAGALRTAIAVPSASAAVSGPAGLARPLRRRAGRLQREHLGALGEQLGLKLLTPYSFAKAIAEGTEVTAQDKQAVDAQVQNHQIKVWIFNSQNVTPDVERVNQLAAENHIPITTVTETLSPASDSFEQWAPERLGRLPADGRTGRACLLDDRVNLAGRA